MIQGWEFMPSAKDSIRDLSSTSMGDSIGIYSVLQFGAIANDGTSQSTEIQSAIDNASVFHLKIGYSLADTFLIRQPLTLKSNLKLEINGVLKQMDSDSSLLTTNADSGDMYVIVTDPSLFQVNDLVTVSDTSANYAGGQTSATNTGQTRYLGDGIKVTSISGDTLHFSGSGLLGGLVDVQGTKGFQVADVAYAGISNTILWGFDVDNIRIFGSGVLDGNRANGFTSGKPFRLTSLFVGPQNVEPRGGQDIEHGNIIALSACDNIKIEGLTIKNAININIWHRWGNYLWVKNCTIDNAWDKNILFLFSNYIWIESNIIINALYEDGIISYSDNKYAWFKNNFIKDNNRNGLAIGGSSDFIFSSNNILINNGTNIAVGANVNYISVGDQCLDGGVWDNRNLQGTKFFSSVNILNASNLQFVNLRVDDSEGFAAVDIQGDCANITFDGGWLRGSDYGLRLRRLNPNQPHDIRIDGVTFSGDSIGLEISNFSTKVTISNCIFQDNTHNYRLEGDSLFKSLIQDGDLNIINTDSLWRGGNDVRTERLDLQAGATFGSPDNPVDSVLISLDTLRIYSKGLSYNMNPSTPRTWLFSEDFGDSTGWDTVEVGNGTTNFNDATLGFHGNNLALNDSIDVRKVFTDTSSLDTWVFIAIESDAATWSNDPYMLQFLDADSNVTMYFLINSDSTFRFRYTTVLSSSHLQLPKFVPDSTIYIWMRFRPESSLGATDAQADLWHSYSGIRPLIRTGQMTNGDATRQPKFIKVMGQNGELTLWDYIRIDDAEIFSIIFY